MEVSVLVFLCLFLSLLNLAVFFQSLDNRNVVIGLEGIILVGIILVIYKIVDSFVDSCLMVTLIVL